MEYQSFNDIKRFLKKNPELKIYEKMLLEFHKASNFNLFFSKLRKAYNKDKSDKSILNELRMAYGINSIPDFHPIFMPEKYFGDDLKKLKQGSYMVFQMPDNVPTKDLAKIKTPDILVFFRGEHFYVEIKTINGKIKKPSRILQKINDSIPQIETFGQGLIQIFCEYVSDELIDNLDIFRSEIISKIEDNENIMGVFLTFFDLISSERLSKNQSKKVYKRRTEYFANKNFKKVFVNPLNKKSKRK